MTPMRTGPRLQLLVSHKFGRYGETYRNVGSPPSILLDGFSVSSACNGSRKRIEEYALRVADI